ncbi:Cryparin [Pseudocercospora fuligena]|uniref:Cryparin n=1 Tax=Pseudocercospora fuligena TaxID=685502 RepID=A0A8H6RV90_9PEZI|nr:Cryparin [Pseudocercospora fuligena]
MQFSLLILTLATLAVAAPSCKASYGQPANYGDNSGNNGGDFGNNGNNGGNSGNDNNGGNSGNDNNNSGDNGAGNNDSGNNTGNDNGNGNSLTPPQSGSVRVCTSGWTPQCCATNVLGVAGVDCSVVPDTITSRANFEEQCSEQGLSSSCCLIPVLGQGLVCQRL